MDAHGQSLHEVVEKESGKVLAELLRNDLQQVDSAL
jgi:hypothetical protein